jgi:hypothetical protein
MGTNKTSNILTSLHGKEIGLNALGQLIVEGSPVTRPTDPLWTGAPSASPYEFYEVSEDFMYPASATASDLTAWTVTSDGGTGTNAFQDAVGGIFNLVTAAADNDYQALSLQHEAFKFAAGKRLWLEARVKLAEATTDDSTWWVGLTDTLTTGGMQADALGPLASYDGALIYKTPETALTLNFESSNAGTQVTSSAEATSVTDTWTRVGFFFDGGNSSSATTATLTPFYAVNGSNTFVKGAAQTITLSGLEEMHLVIGVKAGPGGAAETLQIDYIKCVQER